jgi:hypothetical protein
LRLFPKKQKTRQNKTLKEILQPKGKESQVEAQDCQKEIVPEIVNMWTNIRDFFLLKNFRVFKQKIIKM